MSDRVFLVLIALFATGFIFLPQAVNLFAGQHNWYNLAVEQNMLSSDVNCQKCHADIAEEMSIHKGPHTNETGYGKMECAQCHRVKLGTYRFAAVGDNSSEVFPGEYAHAAATVACMDCHQYVDQHEFDNYTVGGNHRKKQGGDNPYYFGPNENCRKCHAQGQNKNKKNSSKNKFMAIPSAGGFGLTNGTGDNGSRAAHMSFVDSAVNNSALKDENEACIGCHTAAPVKINWSHATNLEFEVKFGKFENSKWNVTGWQANGTANVTVWGNTTGSGTTNANGENWPGNVDNIYT